MAHVQHRGYKEPLIAASAVAAKVPLALDTVPNQVVPVTNATQRPVGLTIASAAQGAPVAVYGEDNIVKAVAAASLGFGAEVGVASTNGALGPISAASGVTKWAVGVSRGPAAAGETFSLHVNPRQLDAQV